MKMDSSEAKETKCLITALLTSSPLKYTINQLCTDFLNTVGYRIPFQRLGFRTAEEYLRSIPDTVKIYGSGNFAEVEGVVKPKSAHINELVMKQKKDSIPNYKRSRIKRFSNHYYQPSTSSYQQRYSYQNQNHSQVFNNNWKNDSHVQSNDDDDDEDDLQSTQQTPSEINKEKVNTYHKESIHSTPEKDVNSVPSEERDCVEHSDQSSEYDEYEAKIPAKIQNNLRKLIMKFPNGIPCTKLPEEYHKMFGKRIVYDKYHYKSLIEMCSDLPEIFRYVQPTSNDFILYDKNKPIPSFNQNDMSLAHSGSREHVGGNVLSEIGKLDWSASLTFIPPDVLHLSDRIPRYFPFKDLQPGEYLDICIGEIYDISKFWIYMLFGELIPLMKELQAFFNNQRNKYLIPEVLLEEGLYCTTLYAGQYHRAVVVNLLPSLPGFVRVLFIDYGTVGNVPSNEIWYLPKKFGQVPAQAIRARLCNVYPVCENRTWSVEAVNRFKQLVTRTALVAEITKIDTDDHVLEIYLADISDEQHIFYINEKLIKEGHALYCDQKQKKAMLDPYCLPKVKYIHLYPEFFEIESGNAPTSVEMNYIITNKIPLHHFMPQYFDIFYNEDVESLQKHHEKSNREPSDFKITPFSNEKLDYFKDFDFTLFPEEMQDEIKNLVKEEEDNLKTQKQIAEQKMAEQKKMTEQKKITELKKSELKKSTERKVTFVKVEPQVESNHGETKDDTSVREYCCNKKRISELRKGGSEKSAVSECGDLSSDFSNSLDLTPETVIPLNNTLNRLHLNNSDLSVINNVTKPNKSTNPFLSEPEPIDTNPFRKTNPFLDDLENTINKNDLFELYAKPLEKKVNNLNTTTELPCKINKPVNNNPFNKDLQEGGNRRVRTPPGFSSGMQTQGPPSWSPQSASPVNFNNNCYSNNPYYQRFYNPHQYNMFSFTMNQAAPGMMPNYYNFVPPCFSPNQFQFNMAYLQQAFGAPNFGQQTPTPPVPRPSMNFGPPQFKK